MISKGVVGARGTIGTIGRKPIVLPMVIDQGSIGTMARPAIRLGSGSMEINLLSRHGQGGRKPPLQRP